MHVVVTGGTGFIGSALCDSLLRDGHQVTVPSRNPAKHAGSMPGVHLVELDRALANWPACDAVVNLAGETVNGRWTPAKKRKIYESRVKGTRKLMEAMTGAAQPPAVLVSASAVGYYGDRGDERLTEESGPGQHFLSRVCIDWERAANQAEAAGIRVAIVRLAVVLGRDGGALPVMLIPFKLGLGGPMAGGRQWFPWVHRQDVVGVLRFALENEVNGALLASAPEPVRQADFAKSLGRAINRPAILPAPAFGLKLLLGEFACELLDSRRAIPERTMALGYQFQHADLDEALRLSLGHSDHAN